ncbi:MAG: Hsp70 family protein [Dehalococcoidia bacterium]
MEVQAIYHSALRNEGAGRWLQELHEPTGAMPFTAALIVGNDQQEPRAAAVITRIGARMPIVPLAASPIVAQGSAVLAGVLTGRIGGWLLLSATTTTYGIGCAGTRTWPVIARGAAIPTQATASFTNMTANQSSLSVRLYEGEAALAAENLPITEIALDGYAEAAAGTAQIDVTLDIDANGALRLRARDIQSGKQVDMMIDPHNSDRLWPAPGNDPQSLRSLQPRT